MKKNISRNLVRMNRHRISDRRIARDMRRFSDDKVSSLIDDCRRLIAKAKAWCVSKAREYPAIFKIIKVLVKIDAILEGMIATSAVTFGGSSLLALKKCTVELKQALNEAEKDAPGISSFTRGMISTASTGGVKIIFKGILLLLTQIIKWKAIKIGRAHV